MIKYFCDLCKSEIHFKKRGIFPVKYNLCLSNNDMDRKDNVTEFELCKDCYNKIFEIVNMITKENRNENSNED